MDLATKVLTTFSTLYKRKPSILVKAPGRINLIGEHTDYNMGYVLPAAIDKCTYFAMHPNGTSTVNLNAIDLSASFSFECQDLTKSDKLWVNYFKGVLSEFKKRDLSVPGFDLVVLSEIPIGAGLSSSAALECGFIKGLDKMIGAGLSDWDIVHIANSSENNYLGIGSGILDQFSSTFGKVGKAMILHCGDSSYEHLTVDLGECCLVLMNTNVKHEHLTSGYIDRVAECKSAQRKLQEVYPEVASLSDATLSMVDQSKVGLTETEKARTVFILQENQRVLDFKNAMEQHALARCGQLLYESHHGLQHLYEVSCFELDLLVDLTRSNENVLGSRMMGGGFGGCTISLMKKSAAETAVEEMKEAYKKATSIEAEAYWVNLSNGVELL